MRRWTEEDDARLIDLARHSTESRWKDIADEFPGRTAQGCKKRFQRICDGVLGDLADHSDIKVESEEGSALEGWQLQIEKPSWDEILQHAQRGGELQSRLRPIYTRARRVIKTDKPIFLVLMSDFHFGSPRTNYQAFFETVNLLQSDDRFYFCVVGPDMEAAFTWFYDASAVLDQTIPPWMQIEAYRMWLDSMLDRAVAICADNHADQRLERYMGDIGVLWREDVPYFRSWGILTLQVGDIEYEILMSHKYKGHSIYHDLQPVLRLFRDLYPLADVYATAHTHSPAMLSGVFYPEARGAGKERQLFVVCGTFKDGMDLWTLRNYANRGVIGMPTLRLHPGRHEIVCFDNPAIALDSS